MINCIKTNKGNRFDILDNRKKSLHQIIGLNYAELEKLYWEIGIELTAEYDLKNVSANRKNVTKKG